MLGSIILRGNTVFWREFGAAISRFPGLNFLILSEAASYSGDAEWKDLFDAIRKHPHAIFVGFRGAWGTMGVWELDFGPNEEIEFKQDDTEAEMEDDSKEAMTRSLTLYLSSRGEWTSVLEKWFPQSF